MVELTDLQLRMILDRSLWLDEIESLLPPRCDKLQAEFFEFQQRVGTAYASGPWTVISTGEKLDGPKNPNPPTVEETYRLFEEVGQVLPEGQAKTEFQDFTAQLLSPSLDIKGLHAAREDQHLRYPPRGPRR